MSLLSTRRRLNAQPADAEYDLVYVFSTTLLIQIHYSVDRAYETVVSKNK